MIYIMNTILKDTNKVHLTDSIDGFTRVALCYLMCYLRRAWDAFKRNTPLYPYGCYLYMWEDKRVPVGVLRGHEADPQCGALHNSQKHGLVLISGWVIGVIWINIGMNRYICVYNGVVGMLGVLCVFGAAHPFVACGLRGVCSMSAGLSHHLDTYIWDEDRVGLCLVLLDYIVWIAEFMMWGQV